MGQSFQDSRRYASLFENPKGPGDARPTALQIIRDNDSIGKLTGKTVLLTGGSNGLGIDEVRNLARTGAKVFFTSRDHAKGERVRDELLQELKKESLPQEPAIEVIKLDLESVESIKNGAEEFKSKSDQLHILVNNAGIANSPFRLVEGYESQLWVDHLAHFYLFHLLKPLLLKSTTPSFNSRVVSVASLAHTMAPMHLGDYNFEEREYDEFVAYARAKTANIWFANELDRRYGSQGLHAISVHPGGIRTGLQNSHSEKAAAMIEQYLQMPHIQDGMMSVEQGSASIVLAAVGKEYEGVGGFYMENCGVSRPVPEDAPLGTPGYKPWAYDKEGEQQLWKDSLDMLKLEDD
ncbi:uncharacterized protein LTR77_001180 [Saxophila tyrrhenica]|uniref:Short-chain dehydrogenase n=1 Tax=Saxophila tyrrhenica TaxID=1690608 RepID=A0AAV9PJJ8_9PEZI|nr:hypothetical protein LTR77_001180 [Saxophila tyrrhenica]